MKKKEACAYSGCYHYAFCKGLCRTHYWQQHVGRELAPIRFHGKNLTPKMRFDRLWSVDKDTGCWLWEGAIHPQKGYGMFWFNTTVKNMYAHRAAWVLYNGEILDDPNHAYRTLGVLHRCDNGLCVNPDHLFLGTHAENMRDATRKKRFKGKQGEEHPQAKVTVEIVRAIRRSTARQRAIAQQYGISQHTVGEIQRRETWKHVEDVDESFPQFNYTQDYTQVCST